MLSIRQFLDGGVLHRTHTPSIALRITLCGRAGRSNPSAVAAYLGANALEHVKRLTT
jgi:hypothetical protein